VQGAHRHAPTPGRGRAAERSASDTDLDVVLHQLGERDPLHGRWTRSHLTLRTDIPLDHQVAEIETFLDRR
jgi:hypothetical protein